MTIDELIERLQWYKDSLGGETKVRIMTQPNWPFENEIAGLVSAEEISGQDKDDDDESASCADDKIVYIAEGTQIGYGNKRVWDEAY